MKKSVKVGKQAALILSIFLTLSSGKIFGTEPKVTIQKGSTVTFHYTLSIDSNIVDSSASKKPFTYVQGAGQMIPGLEDQMKGLKKGDKRHITVSPEKGYGPIHPDAFQNVSKNSFKDPKALKVGGTVTGQFNGQLLRATIVSIEDDNVTLDLNHPLAGKTLQFNIEIVDVKSGSQKSENFRTK